MRIFTLLAATACGLTMMAQSNAYQLVKVENGNVVATYENGQTVECDYVATIASKGKKINFTWETGLFLKSTSQSDTKLTMVFKAEKEEWGCCFGGNCFQIAEGENHTFENVTLAAGALEDLQIHTSWRSDNELTADKLPVVPLVVTYPTEPLVASLNITSDAGNCSYVIKGMPKGNNDAIDEYNEKNGVEENMADVTAPVAYYDLMGRCVANPQHGLFIKKQGSKAVKVVL